MHTGSRQHADGVDAVGRDRVSQGEKRSMKGREGKVGPLPQQVSDQEKPPGSVTPPVNAIEVCQRESDRRCRNCRGRLR